MLQTGRNSNRPGRNSRGPLSFVAIHGSECPTFCNHNRSLRRTMRVLLRFLVPHNAEHMVDHRCNLLNAIGPNKFQAVLLSFCIELAEGSIVLPAVPQMLHSLI
jgi:hypothetical protein